MISIKRTKNTKEATVQDCINMFKKNKTTCIENGQVIRFESNKSCIRKKRFIKKLSKALKLTREGIKNLELLDNETVQINYKNGYTKKVNIAGSSYTAIMKDVLNNL